MPAQVQAVAPFTKVCRLGTTRDYSKSAQSVYVKIDWDGVRLSITGVVGPRKSGNCVGPAGQIDDTLRNVAIDPAVSWSLDQIGHLCDLWERWHLNDLVPGTPAQMEVVRAWRDAAKDASDRTSLHAIARDHGYRSLYDRECDLLARVDLLYDGDYKYGSAWLREDVPDEALSYLKNLPSGDKEPAWV